MVEKNGDYPVTHVRVYRRTTVLLKRAPLPSKNRLLEPRGCISTFTMRSRQRMIFHALNSVNDWLSMVTLTYPLQWPSDGKIVKKHLQEILRGCKLRSFSVLWVMEYQTRGAPHFHLLCSVPPSHTGWMRPLWSHALDTDDRRHLKRGFHVTPLQHSQENNLGMCVYLATHGAKKHQKTVPPGVTNSGRWWGKVNLHIAPPVVHDTDTYGAIQALGVTSISSKGKTRKYVHVIPQIH